MYTIKKIAEILNASAKLVNENAAIVQLLTDSRRLIFPETTLFFAITTAQRDAHIFIGELYERGVQNFVVKKDFDTTPFTQANFILVDDVLHALQKIAAFHRLQFSYPVIAITGSNGKTIVKEWLYQLLSSNYKIVRSPRSYNSQIGVPLSLWQLNETYNLAIIEAGISTPNEMQRLEEIIQPTIGIFTNIGNAHDENFTSRAEKIKEKSLLFKYSKNVIANTDNNELINILKTETSATLFTWGKGKENIVSITSTEKKENATQVSFLYQQHSYNIVIPFTDEASVQNAMSCICMLLLLQIDINVIKERILTLQPVDMRLQLTPAINNCALINDSYSFDIASFSVALDFMQQQNQFNKKTVILSDFPGAGNEGIYAEIVFMLKAKNIQRAIIIGEQWSLYYPFMRDAVKHVEHFATTEIFLLQFSTNHFRDELILLK